MSWLFPLAKSASSSAAGSPAGLTSLQQQKQRLIESLRNSHSSIAEIQKDVEYRLPFTVNNLTININILYSNPGGMPPYPAQGFPFLPPYPPQEANRNIASLSVADTVSSSTTSYTAAKPVAPSFGILSSLPLPVPTTESSAPINQNGFGYKMPDIPDAFPELSELSVSQLTDMNEQEDVLLEQFLTLPQLKQIITDKEDLVKSIEELARKNLLLEHSLETKRQTVLDKYELLIQMKSTFEKKMQRQHELSESCSASALQARLKVAAHEAEEESDNIAEEFLEGKTEIDDFLSSFKEKRTICHCRRAKEEKLHQVIAMHSQFHAPL
ncbi:vacuolar protein sorting-associated protein 37A isoform X3 [Chionomys nivalis]|uniref:vacuolar protein sorting-associated protein 37A isoform X3 n=1 Tax=Chionomys nivalis TaxID=269649 RepID=UPI0025970DEC|nr:vacuolar protein sorting-associated protein 37A isoform X3 [Chionomys nivalis]